VTRRRIDNRTIIVLTRLSADELHVTYCNALGANRPYVLTTMLTGEPFAPAGVTAAQIPDVGATRTIVSDG
jgi:hypothetical protein